MKRRMTMTTVSKWASAVTCCLLIGCGSRTTERGVEPTPGAAPAQAPAKSALSFREQQKKLFYETDHELVYRSCQELMRSSRAGRLSAGTYYRNGPAAKWSELPGPLRRLEPALVQVDELMVNMTFLSTDGVQHLQCICDEFGELAVPEDDAIGFGFRADPFVVDQLSGRESLDDLNQKYKHFEICLMPGLNYAVYGEDPARTLEQMKRR